MLLTLKIILAPLCIGLVTLAGRRWGPAVSGLLTGLPLTSGPVSLILALQYGRAFAARAATGTLVGEVSVCAFCLAYTIAARRTNWPLSVLAASAAYLAATLVWNEFTWSLLPAFAFLLLAIAVVARCIPQRPVAQNAFHPPRWDLPARMVLVTVFVLALTTVADTLGPQLSGLLAPFPVFATVLATFTHRQQGPEAAAQLLRGVVVGMSASACFLLMVGGLVTRMAVGPTYVLAAIAAIGASAVALQLKR